METHAFFLNLFIILMVARLFGEFAVRMGMPSVIGKIIVGIVIGPTLLGWAQPDNYLQLLAELGIIMLLFEVGLDTHARRLGESGREPITVAVLGFTVPLALGYVVAHYYFDLSDMVALFIGGTLTATSIGITMRVLSDLQRRNSREG